MPVGDRLEALAHLRERLGRVRRVILGPVGTGLRPARFVARADDKPSQQKVNKATPELSQAGFDGELDPRMSSWGEEILHGHVESEEVPGGVAGAGRAA